MIYKNIVYGHFLSRTNRFIAEVEINNQIEIVHVKNTGRCKEILKFGVKVALEKSNSLQRKTKYDLVSVEISTNNWINIDSLAPNEIVAEWLSTQNLEFIKREYTYKNSRFDFMIENNKQKMLLEAKGCTLNVNGTGYFPDAPTARGTKHLNELSILSKEFGITCAIVFVIQINGVTKVLPQQQIDLEFANAWKKAKESNVKFIFLPCSVDDKSIVTISNQKLLQLID